MRDGVPGRLAALALALCALQGISGECTDESVISGFLDPDDITNVEPESVTSVLALSQSLGVNISHWIFPDMTFLCDGVVRGLQLRARTQDLSDTDSMTYPQIVIWKRGIDQLNVVYERKENASRSIEVSTSGMATFTLPLPVEAGDILGLYFPSRGSESVRLSFKDCEEDGGPESYYVGGQSEIFTIDINGGLVNSSQCTPLLRPLLNDNSITPFPPATPSPMVPPNLPTSAMPASAPPTSGLGINPSPSSFSFSSLLHSSASGPGTPTTNPPSAGSNIITIVAPVIAALALLLTVLLAVVFLLVCVRRRQAVPLKPSVGAGTVYEEPHINNLHNPTYLGVTSEDKVRDGESQLANGTYEDLQYQQLGGPATATMGQDSESHSYAYVHPPSVVSPHGTNASASVVPLPMEYEGFVPLLSTPSQYEIPVTSDSIKSKELGASQEQQIDNVLKSGGIFVPTEDERSALIGEQKESEVDHKMYHRMSKHYYNTLVSDSFFEEDDIYWRPASSKRALYDQLSKKKYREILRPQVQIVDHLGSGQFGMVNKGLWQLPTETMEVAVKTLQPGASEQDKVKFLQEAAIMGQFFHPNVVKLLGVVTVGEPTMIVLEFMPKGDLRNWLQGQRPLPGELASSDLPQLLVKFCRDVASGMEYLSNKAFVHRDLAARNVLLDDHSTCKIGDFGLSRDLEDNNYYIVHGGQIPVKWTAPEALNFRKYSTASDVWSFGVVMYEIWSLGRKPFEGYTNHQMMQLIGSGIRMTPPPGTPRPLYGLMIRCWHGEASLRPTFSAIINMLSHSNPQLLSWTERDRASHSQATCLGAPLEAGEQLYVDLQDYYLDEESKRSTSSSNT